MANAELNVTPRDRVGKETAKKLRRQGLVPAVVYGRGMQPLSVTVAPKALATAIAGEAGWNTLITLRGESAVDGRVVIVKDLQISAIRRDLMHADFQVINLNEKVHVMVPVHPVGKSAGEKAGGNLQVIRHELEVVCLPGEIPTAIEVDVTSLDIGDTLHIEDLVLPPGIQAPHDVNFTVITITGRKGEEEEIAAEGETIEEA
jgi:large subunit ribosomal protein L25